MPSNFRNDESDRAHLLNANQENAAITRHDDELDPLPPDAREAFASYPFPRPRSEFDARFWRELDARRNRYRGFAGFLRRIVEVEIEGVAVWRLGLSTFSGGAFCLLTVGLALQMGTSRTVSPLPSLPLPNPVPPTQLYAFAWSRRALENGLWPDEKLATMQRPASNNGKDFSCTSSNAPWA